MDAERVGGVDEGVGVDWGHRRRGDRRFPEAALGFGWGEGNCMGGGGVPRVAYGEVDTHFVGATIFAARFASYDGPGKERAAPKEIRREEKKMSSKF